MTNDELNQRLTSAMEQLIMCRATVSDLAADHTKHTPEADLKSEHIRQNNALYRALKRLDQVEIQLIAARPNGK